MRMCGNSNWCACVCACVSVCALVQQKQQPHASPGRPGRTPGNVKCRRAQNRCARCTQTTTIIDHTHTHTLREPTIIAAASSAITRISTAYVRPLFCMHACVRVRVRQLSRKHSASWPPQSSGGAPNGTTHGDDVGDHGDDDDGSSRLFLEIQFCNTASSRDAAAVVAQHRHVASTSAQGPRDVCAIAFVCGDWFGFVEVASRTRCAVGV